ncbi:rhodanese-like domain-containing protein [Aerococcaceae bacterium NML190938]|nr:rhodanese-like domain-containing protein [Aerococcaceae bacterium NML190938]
MFRTIKEWFRNLPTISTNELETLLREQHVELIDVRSPQEYCRAHIKQAKNIPLEKIDHYRAPQDKTVYLICQSGMRSKKATKILTQQGYNAVNIRGGMMAWKGSKIIGS